jgi:cytochrome c oxidase subunit 2
MSGIRSDRLATPAALALVVVSCLVCGCGGTTRGAATAPGGFSAQDSPIAHGRVLYQADGCAGCHSLDGSRMSGPSWKGLAGSRVRLSDGRVLTAGNAYLTRHIVEPDALTVQGYPGNVMAESIQGLDLQRRPADVAALVAFIDTVR